MTQAYVTIVGTLKDNNSSMETPVTLSGYADVIMFRPGSPPPRPHPEPPLGIWGPTDPRPWNPISGIPGIPGFEPGHPPGDGGHEPKFEWKTGWTPESGWVVVAIPLFEHVTPSAQASKAPPKAP